MRQIGCGGPKPEQNNRKNITGYLFNYKALVKVFRAKMLDAIKQQELELHAGYPETWVVDCKSVGTGRKSLICLYRGVIQEKDIIACQQDKVTFR